MIDFRVSGFDWDEGNRAKCQKHGLTVAHIEALFAAILVSLTIRNTQPTRIV